MVTQTIPCPDSGLNLTQDPITGVVSMTVLCSDSNNNGLINGLPTIFYDCTGDPGEGQYTLLIDGQTFVYDGRFTHQIFCGEDCGIGAGLPDIIDWDCGIGPDLPITIDWN